MAKRSFFSLFFFVVGCLIFVKIYQSNKFIKKNYEKQRLEKSLQSLLKKIDGLMLDLESLQRRENIVAWAKDQKQLQLLKLDNIVTVLDNAG